MIDKRTPATPTHIKECWCGSVTTLDSSGCVASEYHDPSATRRVSECKKIYISGPMSGYDECNYPAFNAAAEELRSLGYEVFNPAEHNTGASYWETLRGDMEALLTCDAVALLDGWHYSKGASIEVHMATVLEHVIRPIQEWLKPNPTVVLSVHHPRPSAEYRLDR